MEDREPGEPAASPWRQLDEFLQGEMLRPGDVEAALEQAINVAHETRRARSRASSPAGTPVPGSPTSRPRAGYERPTLSAQGRVRRPSQGGEPTPIGREVGSGCSGSVALSGWPQPRATARPGGGASNDRGGGTGPQGGVERLRRHRDLGGVASTLVASSRDRTTTRAVAGDAHSVRHGRAAPVDDDQGHMAHAARGEGRAEVDRLRAQLVETTDALSRDRDALAVALADVDELRQRLRSAEAMAEAKTAAAADAKAQADARAAEAAASAAALAEVSAEREASRATHDALVANLTERVHVAEAALANAEARHMNTSTQARTALETAALAIRDARSRAVRAEARSSAMHTILREELSAAEGMAEGFQRSAETFAATVAEAKALVLAKDRELDTARVSAQEALRLVDEERTMAASGVRVLTSALDESDKKTGAQEALAQAAMERVNAADAEILALRDRVQIAEASVGELSLEAAATASDLEQLRRQSHALDDVRRSLGGGDDAGRQVSSGVGVVHSLHALSEEVGATLQGMAAVAAQAATDAEAHAAAGEAAREEALRSVERERRASVAAAEAQAAALARATVDIVHVIRRLVDNIGAIVDVGSSAESRPTDAVLLASLQGTGFHAPRHASPERPQAPGRLSVAVPWTPPASLRGQPRAGGDGVHSPPPRAGGGRQVRRERSSALRGDDGGPLARLSSISVSIGGGGNSERHDEGLGGGGWGHPHRRPTLGRARERLDAAADAAEAAAAAADEDVMDFLKEALVAASESAELMVAEGLGAAWGAGEAAGTSLARTVLASELEAAERLVAVERGARTSAERLEVATRNWARSEAPVPVEALILELADAERTHTTTMREAQEATAVVEGNLARAREEGRALERELERLRAHLSDAQRLKERLPALADAAAEAAARAARDGAERQRSEAAAAAAAERAQGASEAAAAMSTEADGLAAVAIAADVTRAVAERARATAEAEADRTVRVRGLVGRAPSWPRTHASVRVRGAQRGQLAAVEETLATTQAQVDDLTLRADQYSHDLATARAERDDVERRLARAELEAAEAKGDAVRALATERAVVGASSPRAR